MANRQLHHGPERSAIFAEWCGASGRVWAGPVPGIDRSHVSCCASERAAAADAAHLQVNVFWEGLCQWAGEQSRPIRAEQIKRRFYSRSDSLWRVTCKRQSSLLWEQFSFWYFSQPKNMNNVCILKISDIFQKIVSHVSCFTSVNSNIHILTF